MHPTMITLLLPHIMGKSDEERLLHFKCVFCFVLFLHVTFHYFSFTQHVAQSDGQEYNGG